MSQKVDTTIRFSGLKPGRYIYSYTLADEFFEEWENDEIRGGKVEIEAKMERLEHMLMFTFALKGEVTTMCDRCLGDLVIDLAQWLYEYVAVRIPMQHIHPDGECDPEVTKYIVDEDEIESKKNDDEIDPRWEALKKLK